LLVGINECLVKLLKDIKINPEDYTPWLTKALKEYEKRFY